MSFPVRNPRSGLLSWLSIVYFSILSYFSRCGWMLRRRSSSPWGLGSGCSWLSPATTLSQITVTGKNTESQKPTSVAGTWLLDVEAKAKAFFPTLRSKGSLWLNVVGTAAGVTSNQMKSMKSCCEGKGRRKIKISSGSQKKLRTWAPTCVFCWCD